MAYYSSWYFSTTWLWYILEVQRIKSIGDNLFLFFFFRRNSMSSNSWKHKQLGSSKAARWKEELKKIKHREHADKETNGICFPLEQIQGKQKVTQKFILDSTDVCTAFWFATIIPLLRIVQGNEVMILRREKIYKRKQKRGKNKTVFKCWFFQQEFTNTGKNLYQNPLLTSNLQLAETAQATDSNCKQSGMHGLYKGKQKCKCFE